MTAHLAVGKVGRPSWPCRLTEVAGSVDRKAQVGRPRYPQSVDRVAQVGRPKSPRGSGTFSSDQPNSPTTPFRLSAALQATLRLTSDNSPPYFDASKAESFVEQGGESRHIRRRVSPSRTERVSTRGRRQCRRAGWGISAGRCAQVGRLGWYRSARRRRPCRQADPFHAGVPTFRGQHAENTKGAG